MNLRTRAKNRREFFCARPGCGEKTKRERNKYCSARCNAAHHHDLYCSASLPIKKWYGNCRVCNEELPMFKGEFYTMKNAPKACRAIFNEKCYKKIKKMVAFDAAMKRGGKPRKTVVALCFRCGDVFEGLVGKKFCSKECRIQNQREKITVEEFSRAKCCKRKDLEDVFDHHDNGTYVHCAKYLNELEHDFKRCARVDCFEWPKMKRKEAKVRFLEESNRVGW